MKAGEEFKKFNTLFYKWVEDTRFHSLYAHYIKHPNFEEILQMPHDDLLGYAAMHLNDHFHHAHLILNKIVPKDKLPPFHPYYAGRIPVMRECWKFWALQNGILITQHNPDDYWEEDKHGNTMDELKEEDEQEIVLFENWKRDNGYYIINSYPEIMFWTGSGDKYTVTELYEKYKEQCA